MEPEKSSLGTAQPRKTAAKKPDEPVDPSKFKENRLAALAEFAASTSLPIYPHKFATDISVKEFVAKYSHLEEEQRVESDVVTLAGRVMRLASGGPLLKFYDLVSNGQKIQVMADVREHDEAASGASFNTIHGVIRRGDIIGVRGVPGRTKRGELSVHPSITQMLSPCLHMLPLERTGLKDPETRCRQRYLDLLTSPSSRAVFEKRSLVIRHLRKYFDDRDFVEVETPMMNALAGGATARPFITHHNELNTDLFMRVAPELFLKMLVVGGMDRVYEIGKNFRNEGIDMTHNPEFTSCEFYMAYGDLYDMLDMTEEIVSSMAQVVNGSHRVTITHSEICAKTKETRKERREVDFTPPFKRVSMVEEIEKNCGVKLPRPLDGAECIAEMRRIVMTNKLDLPHPATPAKLLDKLCGHFVESQIVNPTFIIEHPQLMSPLAKWHRSKPELSERGELFVNGKEVANFYTELNDPQRQLQCFQSQLQDRAAGDDEAQPVDISFVAALEHGLPPTGGWGMGIDRMTMFLTDSDTIKDVILFPAMRHEGHKKGTSM